MKTSIHYRPDIDGLRAVAIIGVVLFHAFPKAFRGGFVGVDVFFVISGYLITRILLRRGAFERGWLLHFYHRRIIRILPALTLVVAVSAIAGYFLLYQGEYAELGRQILASGLFAENIHLWRSAGYFDTLTEEKPLMHLWSLAVEEQFYLIYPLILFALHKTHLALGKAILIGIVISFLLNLYAISTDSSAAFYLPQNRFWELFIGGYIALKNPLTNASRWLSGLISITGFALIMVAFSIIRSEDHFPGYWALLPTLGAACLIVAGEGAPINAWLLSRKYLVRIGLISYPLYLWHWPLLSFERIIDNGIRSIPVTVSLILASVAFSVVTYRWVELTARNAGRKAVPVLLVLLVLLTVLGGAIDFSKGVPERGSRFAESSAGLQTLVEGEHGWLDGCASASRKSDAEPDIAKCTYYQKKSDAQHLVLVLGDSHASALVKGIDTVNGGFIETSRIYLFDQAGCLPFRDVDIENTRKRCSLFFNPLYAWMAVNANRIDAVILASRWASHYDGSGFSPGEHRHVFVSDRYPAGDVRSLFEMGLRDSIDFFRLNHIPVIFVDQVPELNFSPSACFNRPFSFRERRDPCAIARDKVEMRQRGYRSVVETLVTAGSPVKRIAPMNLFCDDALCWAKDGDRFLYSDDDHLSREGSGDLIREIGRHIELAGPH